MSPVIVAAEDSFQLLYVFVMIVLAPSVTVLPVWYWSPPDMTVIPRINSRRQPII